MPSNRKKRQGYFEGWYFKQQTPNDTIAFIPAYHIDQQGKGSASLQIITNERVYQLDYPAEALQVAYKPLRIRLGKNVFGLDGCRLDCMAEGTRIRGVLHYIGITRLASDIMGPFRYLPGMECRHSVFSLRHRVEGRLWVGERELVFHRGAGYIEGDRGRSFPSRYLWTQCNWGNSSVMLSVAEIPYGGMRFTGCIGVVLFAGRQYRFATYYGVRLVHISPRELEIRQGNMTLWVRLEVDNPHPLRAPTWGRMERTIHESPACRVRYRMTVGGKTVFDRTSEQAGFESVWADR